MTDDDVLNDAEQEQLMRLLGSAIDEVDPVPPSAISFANESRRLIAFEAEFGEIVSDSLVDDLAVRSSGASRTLVFRAGDVTIRVEFDGDQLVGSVEPPPSGGIVTLQRSDGNEVEIELNERGFFSYAPIEGRFRFRLRTEDVEIVTDWLRR